MKNSTCPLCNCANIKILSKYFLVEDNFKIVECTNCSHIYTYIGNEIDITKYYEEGTYKVIENRGSVFDKILSIEGNSILKKILSLDDKVRGRLLDFGCGKGKFLSLAQNRGWKVIGVETSESRSSYANKVYKIEVKSLFYVKGKIDSEKFDVITLFHVLEHLPSPLTLLDNLIKDNLKVGGIVVIEVPNIKSLQSRIAKSKWIHLDIPRHISHFDMSKLEEVLSDLNLSPLKVEYFSFQHGVLGMITTLMGLAGYKNNLIYELKNNLTIKLLLTIIFILPIAIILELFACLFNGGGVLRIYSKLTPRT